MQLLTEDEDLTEINPDDFGSRAEAITAVIIAEYERGLGVMAAVDISIERVEMTVTDLGAFMLGFMSSKLSPLDDDLSPFYEAGRAVRSHLYDIADGEDSMWASEW